MGRFSGVRGNGGGGRGVGEEGLDGGEVAIVDS